MAHVFVTDLLTFMVYLMIQVAYPPIGNRRRTPVVPTQRSAHKLPKTSVNQSTINQILNNIFGHEFEIMTNHLDNERMCQQDEVVFVFCIWVLVSSLFSFKFVLYNIFSTHWCVNSTEDLED